MNNTRRAGINHRIAMLVGSSFQPLGARVDCANQLSVTMGGWNQLATTRC